MHHHIIPETKTLDYDAFLHNISIDAVKFYQSTKKKAVHMVIPLNRRLKQERSIIIPNLTPLQILTKTDSKPTDHKRSAAVAEQEYEPNSVYNL